MIRRPGALKPPDIRDYRPGDAAALHRLWAAVTAAGGAPPDPAAAPRPSDDGRLWLATLGRRLGGYVAVQPLPGLPGLFDLTGGVAPKRRQQGVGGRLLAHAVTHAPALGARQFSAHVETLAGEPAQFLLRRGFALEHEECLLTLDDLAGLPPVPDDPAVALVNLPRQPAITAFCRVYTRSFDGRPWSQPYTEAEVAAALARPNDLLFAVIAGEPIGVVWHERLPDGRGRVEPIGVAREHQGRGHGRRLLLAALHDLRRRGAASVEIGLWRTNDMAMNLYKGLGFSEVANWYYLARDLPLNVE